MTISEKNYRKVVQEAKKLVPKFRYTSDLKKKARLDYSEVDGLYLVADNLICLHKANRYQSRKHLAQVLYHELSHWCMAWRNTHFQFSSRYSYHRDLLEEIIAELTSFEIALRFGYYKHKKEFDTYAMSKYKKELRKEIQQCVGDKLESSQWYQECLAYADKYANKLVNYICN